jgi:hypothetical protein
VNSTRQDTAFFIMAKKSVFNNVGVQGSMLV